MSVHEAVPVPPSTELAYIGPELGGTIRLLAHCAGRPGIVSAISRFFLALGAAGHLTPTLRGADDHRLPAFKHRPGGVATGRTAGVVVPATSRRE